MRCSVSSTPTTAALSTIFQDLGRPRRLGSLESLDEGEKVAIALDGFVHADLLLMDDREGVAAARNKGLRVTGTLGVLDLPLPDIKKADLCSLDR